MASQLNQVPASLEPIATLGDKNLPVTVSPVWYKFFTSVSSVFSNGIAASALLDSIGSVPGGMLARFAASWQEFVATQPNQIPVMAPGVPVALKSISQLLDLISNVRGSVLFRGAAAWQSLPPAVAGKFLQTQGPGADPVYAPAGTVIGPLASVDGNVAVFNGVTGQSLRDSGTGLRQQLTADTTYYVRSDGSDANNGLTNNAVGAFLTIAHAMAVVSALDCASFQLTVSVQAATWTTQVILPRMLASKRPILTGIGSTTIISTVADADAILADGSTPWSVQNMKLTVAGVANGSGILIKNGAFVAFSGIEFGAMQGFGVRALGFTGWQATGPCSASGNAQGLIITNGFGDMNTQWTFANAVTYSLATVSASKSGGELDANLATFVNPGNVTGAKYFGTINSGIFTGTGGAAGFFPGTVAGSVSNGAQYQ